MCVRVIQRSRYPVVVPRSGETMSRCYIAKRVYKYACGIRDRIWSRVSESDDSRKNRDVKGFYRKERHRAGGRARARVLSKSYANRGARAGGRRGGRVHRLFFPDLRREISLSRGLWCARAGQERTGAKRVARRGKGWPRGRNIGSPRRVTSGEASFQESESNVTWRGESEGTDVETVMSNRYFYKRPRTSESVFGNPTPARSARVPRNCIKFHKLFHRRDSEVKALKRRVPIKRLERGDATGGCAEGTPRFKAFKPRVNGTRYRNDHTRFHVTANK